MRREQVLKSSPRRCVQSNLKGQNCQVDPLEIMRAAQSGAPMDNQSRWFNMAPFKGLRVAKDLRLI